jgi:2'-5' RNA ligase
LAIEILVSQKRISSTGGLKKENMQTEPDAIEPCYTGTYWINIPLHDFAVDNFIAGIQSHIDPNDWCPHAPKNKPLCVPGDAHVTLLLGIHANSPNEVLTRIPRNIPSPQIQLRDLSYFRNEICGWDVLIAPVVSESLQSIRRQLEEAFPDAPQYRKTFNPHVTIGYLNLGSAWKYMDNNIKPLDVTNSAVITLDTLCVKKFRDPTVASLTLRLLK